MCGGGGASTPWTLVPQTQGGHTSYARYRLSKPPFTTPSQALQEGGASKTLRSPPSRRVSNSTRFLFFTISVVTYKMHNRSTRNSALSAEARGVLNKKLLEPKWLTGTQHVVGGKQGAIERCEWTAGKRPATLSQKHGFCPPFGFQQRSCGASRNAGGSGVWGSGSSIQG